MNQYNHEYMTAGMAYIDHQTKVCKLCGRLYPKQDIEQIVGKYQNEVRSLTTAINNFLNVDAWPDSEEYTTAYVELMKAVDKDQQCP